MNLFNHQFQSVLWKNYVIMTKSKKEFLKEMLIPFLSVLIIFGASEAQFNLLLEFNQTLSIPLLELMLPIYIPSSFSSLARKLLVDIVHEKKTKYREIYRIMGLKVNSYRFAWLFTYYLKCQIIFIIISASFLISKFISFSEIFIFCLSYQLFFISAVNQTFMISAFFNHPDLAGEFGSFVLFITSFFYFFVFLLPRSVWLYIFICLFPQSGFSLILMTFISQSGSFLKEEFDIKMGILLQILNSFLYLGLFFYFEDVLPNHGQQKHWLYFLKRTSKVKVSEIEFQKLTNYFPVNQEISYTSLKQENEGEIKCAISIENLNKFYQNNHAVQDLTLKIYEGTIFCLLGHNGAGKTTTLSILTGLIKKSSGNIIIQDHNLDYDIEQIQNKIGFCCQQDILYDELTVSESLEYQAKLRGFKQPQINNQIHDIINQIGLNQYKKVETKKLSGGNKRKLSLGIALIANSEIIFLDEPTSAMDPVSRRQIWDILIKLKEQRKTIILTTHYLQEAENLADKIAILKKGQLIIIGTANSIKDKFNVGYTLQISQKNKKQINEESKEMIDKSLQNHLKNFKIMKQTSDESLKIFIGNNEQNKLASFFKEFESNQEFYMTIKKNTLEDAYLQLNKDDEDSSENEVAIEIQNREDVFQMKITKSKIKKFYLQVKAMFLRKYLMTTRSFSVILMIIFPLLFIILSVIIGSKYLNTIEDLNLKVFFVGLFIVQQYTLNSSIYIFIPLNERENKIRQQLKQMGTSPIAYWLGTILCDYIFFLISVLTIYLCLSSNYLTFYHPFLTKTIQLLTSFGLFMISYSYLFSFAFLTSMSAFKTFPVINFLIAYTIPLIVCDFFVQNNEIIKSLFVILSPFYALDQGLKELTKEKDESSKYFNLMLFEGIIILYLTYKLESFKTTFTNNKKSSFQDSKLQIANVSHQYDNKVALKSINLELRKQTIVSLLGPNGAGKTTLIQLITDIFKLQRGQISYVENNRISVCQQQEGLWEELTALEMIKMYSWIKGGEQYNDNECKAILNQLGLKGKIKEMSGGQKRKMGIAITLIGQDEILIFDEPSAGLDPFSKRKLWKLIQSHVLKYRTSVILTTHDMDEATNLSDEISILINGQIVVNDTVQSLIEQFGSGYKIIIKSKIEREYVIKYVQFRIPYSKVVEATKENQEEISFTIDQDQFKLSETIDLFENLQNEQIAYDVRLNQANLESVFLYYAKFQMNE